MCKLRILSLLFILLFSVILFYQRKTISESFMTGTDVQLLTSKPHYTMYDYISNRNNYRRPYVWGYPSPIYPYTTPFYNEYNNVYIASRNAYPYEQYYTPSYF